MVEGTWEWVTDLGGATNVVSQVVELTNQLMGTAVVPKTVNLVDQVCTVDPVQVADGDRREGNGRPGDELGRGHHGVGVGLTHDRVESLHGQEQTSQKESHPLKNKESFLLHTTPVKLYNFL